MTPTTDARIWALAFITLAASGHGAAAQQVTGAGSTLAAPIYAKWGEAARPATGVELNYQPIGSGAGLNQVVNRTVDFGASDAPVDPTKLASAHLLQFPTVMGAVVMIVNIPGIKPGELKLTGDVVSQIYLGHVTKWNDPKIAELNQGVKLPSVAIAPIYRADASGTSFVFTSYLGALAPDWKSQVGVGTSVKWPVGNGAKGSDGVAAYCQAGPRRHRLHRIRLCGGQPPHTNATAQSRWQVRRADHGGVLGRSRQRRLDPRAGFCSEPGG